MKTFPIRSVHVKDSSAKLRDIFDYNKNVIIRFEGGSRRASFIVCAIDAKKLIID